MAIKTISGTLTIPAGEPSTSGLYDDLSLKLYFVDGLTETLDQTSTVSTANTYSFTYDDAGGDQVRVKLIRISTDVVLAASVTRGILPRSFLVPSSDAAYFTDLITSNYTYDAGLAVLATTGGRYFELAKEITNGIVEAETATAIPFKVHHVDASYTDAYYRTGTVAMVAYSLGYYLEQQPTADNKIEVAEMMYKLLTWLSNKRSSIHGGLLTAGNGRYVAGTFDDSFVDDYASTVDNIIAYFAFAQAGKILNPMFTASADSLEIAIYVKLYNGSTDRFYGGIYPTGVNTSSNLETNIMGAVFTSHDNNPDAANALLEYIESDFICVDSTNNLTAYKATTSDTNIWFEGSYLVALAYYKAGSRNKCNQIIRTLNRFQDDTDGSFKYGIIKNGEYQVKTWKSVGSTAWSYILNIFPEDIFSIRDVGIIPGLGTTYLNEEVSGLFLKEGCTGSTVPSAVVYVVPAGSYISLVSQDDANDQAQDDVDDNGQDYANANGTCDAPPLYTNTERNHYFFKNNCSLGLTGTPVLFTVAAGIYGSNTSQLEADAKADYYMFNGAGQSYANTNGTCVFPLHYVTVNGNLVVAANGGDDDVYLNFTASERVDTNIFIDYEYTLDGSSWITATGFTMSAGTHTSFSFLLATVAGGTGSNVDVNITDITPATFGDQVYYYHDLVYPEYDNELRSAAFTRNDCQGGLPGTSHEYTVAADTYHSIISQEYADALADQYIQQNGQAYVNGIGTCPSNIYYNVLMSEVFAKEGCPTFYTGSNVTYTVPAGTYASSVSQAAANALAQADIDTNGQTYANTNGICYHSASTILITLNPFIEVFGGTGYVYVSAAASEDVTTDIDVYWNYTRLGVPYTGGVITIGANSSLTVETLVGAYPGLTDIDDFEFNIYMLNPEDDGGYHYLY